MNNKILNDAINLVDDDLISEVYSSVNNRKSFNFKYIAAVATFAIVLAVVIIGVKGTNKPLVDNTTNTNDGFGGIDSTEEIVDNEIVFSDSGYTDDEIKAFVEENKFIIADTIATEYQIFDKPIRIATKGYNHVSLGETNILALDILTLPVCIDNKIVATITLFRTDGKINYTIEVQGDSWDKLNKALMDNKNSELTFFYVELYKEIAISPTNEVYEIVGNLSKPLNKNIDYYSKFRTEYNVYSFDILNNKNNYIIVDMSNVNLHTESETKPIETTASQSENATAPYEKFTNADFHSDTIDLSLEDILTLKIDSVEFNNSTRVLRGEETITATEEQKEKILSYISSIKYTEATDYKKGFGGSYIVKLNCEEGSSVEIVFMDKYFYIQNEDGQTPIYIDETQNTINLIYYIVDIIS